MAFASIGSATSGNSSTANQSSIVTASYSHTAGRLYVAILAMDNNQTTDGDESAVSSVSDTNGTWSKAVGFCNGQGAAQAGATCEIWYTIASGTGSSTTTFNLTNSAARDKTAWSIWEFTVDGTVTVPFTNTRADDAADLGQVTTTSAVGELLVRGIATESNTTTTLTTTAFSGTWTAVTQSVTAGGGAAANMGVRGEFLIADLSNRHSDPSLFSADHASALAVFRQVPAFQWYPMGEHGHSHESLIRPVQEMVPY